VEGRARHAVELLPESHSFGWAIAHELLREIVARGIRQQQLQSSE
jgi:hypothetical protein